MTAPNRSPIIQLSNRAVLKTRIGDLAMIGIGASGSGHAEINSACKAAKDVWRTETKRQLLGKRHPSTMPQIAAMVTNKLRTRCAI